MTYPPLNPDCIQRAIYREFLLEPGLYLEAGLDDLPKKLGSKLDCSDEEAIPQLLASPNLDPLETDELRLLLQIRDMSFSCTAAALTRELQAKGVTYDRCIRMALCYAVLSRYGHVFSALRAAADVNDSYARHHHLYGLILAIEGNNERAKWELGIALHNEPFDTGKDRIRHDQALI